MELHGFMWNRKATMWRRVILMHKLKNTYGAQWTCVSSRTISMEPNRQMSTKLFDFCTHMNLNLWNALDSYSH